MNINKECTEEAPGEYIETSLSLEGDFTLFWAPSL